MSSSNNYADPSYGRPDYIVRRNSSKKTYGYALTLKTSFNSGTLYVDGISYPVNGSEGVLVKNLSYGTHNLYADDRQFNGTDWVGYKEWQNKFYQTIVTDPIRTAGISLNISNGFGSIYTARYVPFYNFTVQDNFVGISYTGAVWIDDVPYDAPKTIEVKEGKQLKITIPSYKENTIDYQFDHWQDDNTTNPRIFTNISGHLNLTAYYKGIPSRYDLNTGYNLSLHTSTIVGRPITLYWNEHPNPIVTKYQIWRKEKPNGDTAGVSHLLATVNRGTTSYTDYEFRYTTVKNQYLLYYDVRPYYSLEQTYSNELWLPVWADNLIFGALDSDLETNLLNDNSPSNKVYENSLSNFPNPFNPSTTINYSLKNSGFVNVKVFDLLGKQVAQLVNEEKGAGNYSVKFDASKLPSGIYIYIINAGDFVQTRKMMLMK